MQESFLTGSNSVFLADLYSKYLQNPGQVDPSWASFFGSLGDEENLILKDLIGASWAPRQFLEEFDSQMASVSSVANANYEATQKTDATEDMLSIARDSINALMLIRSYRVRGHLMADLDPLGLKEVEPHPELEPQSYGFTEEDWDRPIFINGVLGKQSATLREILHILKKTYCGPLAIEFMHIQDPEQKLWIQKRIEKDSTQDNLSTEEKKRVHDKLTEADTFERFLHVKFPGAKRFGLEGGEALIAGLDFMMERASQLGVDEVLFGMAHRGRLNVLTNIIGKPLTEVFYEFQDNASLAEDIQGSGDVKYHLGTSVDREVAGRMMHLSLTPNPSHLEAVDPVVMGKVRAKQENLKDLQREKVMGILVHGDAAFAGQGIVPETLALSELDGYKTGGTIHIIINNQIGFTTNPNQSRSSPYSSDIAKCIQAPIIHVNGDHPEAVVYACRLAIDFKHTFKQDVILDMFCYRRHGHNEMDEPAFTQPLMYKNIRSMPTTYELYKHKLLEKNLINQAYVDDVRKRVESHLQEEMDKATDSKAKEPDWLKGRWAGFDIARQDNRDAQSAVSVDVLKQVGKAITTIPQGFNLNSKLTRLLKAKAGMMETGDNIDWSTAEALAFGTLLCEGNSIRLSGQDCGRGTFSQRHAILTDQETEESYVPLNNIQSKQGLFEVINSPLAEASVLGFEYGYSSAEPNHLVLWEAQFGDFANGAQLIIDQFVMSGEVKWFRMSGLVMLLPHGMEGQGPEHSSARLERFLQMCAEDNAQVVNCTTPANYFHVLRRQLRRNIRKPLILMTPKSLLRHKRAVSSVKEMGPGTNFQRVIGEIDPVISQSPNINRVIICSGKVYYDLLEYRESNRIQNVKIIRLEQYYPFPDERLMQELSPHKNALVIWCQEEPQNNGAWQFVDRRLERILVNIGFSYSRPLYTGRPEAASPATGFAKRHKLEQAALVQRAFQVTPRR